MKNFMKNLKNKALVASTAASATVMAGSVVGVLAGGTPAYQTKVWTAIESIMDYILWFAAVAGVIWAAWGVFQIVMGFKEEDAEKKNRGTMQTIAGMLLVCLRLFLMPILKALLA